MQRSQPLESAARFPFKTSIRFKVAISVSSRARFVRGPDEAG